MLTLLFFIVPAVLQFHTQSVLGKEAQQNDNPAVYQPIPFSVWLDFKALMSSDAKVVKLPIWLESVHVSSALRPEGEVTLTSYRIRFRRFATLNRRLLFRLYFDDKLGKNPSLSAWSETGEHLFESGTLGTSIGLPTSETVSIPMDQVDYIDLDIPGDGSTVRGAFLTSLQKSDIFQSVDIAVPAQTLDPFNNSVASHVSQTDQELYGRLRARLDSTPVVLSKKEGSTVVHRFDIQNSPIVAVLSFAILNADIQELPQIVVNDLPVGAASVGLPDLADPAYTGSVHGLVNGMEIHYEGWLNAQCIIPGSAFKSGANCIYIQSSSTSHSMAIRSVALQLKYDSSTFRYDLVPLNP